MGFDRASHLAQSWGADLVDLGHAGHINVASGFGPWPRGKTLRDGLLTPVSQAKTPAAFQQESVSP
jgi:predicted alpha/beta hydrolase family esterase